MKNIQIKFNNIIYGYDPKRFMPIYEDGQLANRADFIRYKLKNIRILT